MNRTVTPNTCPLRARGDAFLTLNRRRGRIIFSTAAIARMGLKSGKMVVFHLTDMEVVISVTTGCDGYVLRTIRRGGNSHAIGLFASAAVRMILGRCRSCANTVRVRLGDDCGCGWYLLTSEVREDSL